MYFRAKTGLFKPNRCSSVRATSSKKEGAKIHYFEPNLKSGPLQFQQTTLAARVAYSYVDKGPHDKFVFNIDSNEAVFDDLLNGFKGMRELQIYPDLISPDNRNRLKRGVGWYSKIEEISSKQVQNFHYNYLNASRLFQDTNKLCYCRPDPIEPENHEQIAKYITYCFLRYPDRKVLIDFNYDNSKLEHMKKLELEGKYWDVDAVLSETSFRMNLYHYMEVFNFNRRVRRHVIDYNKADWEKAKLSKDLD